MNKLGIYIHIPFCVKKCHYCDFISYTNCQKHILSYVQTLIQEIKKESKEYTQYEVDTIFIGGGTPSYIDSRFIQDILNTIRKSFCVIEDCEISIETNPNSLTLEKLQDYFDAGVNRLSIGLQAKQDRLLTLIGRSHHLEEYTNAIINAKKVGFTNINTDVMLGLPTQTLQDVIETIELAMQNSTHISAYSLILEKGTKLFQQVESGELVLPEEDTVVDMYEQVAKLLEDKGYSRYEVSNFALSGQECKHNLHCWQYQDYLGFGVASHSKIGNKRFSRTTSLIEYIEKTKNNVTTIVEDQHLSKDDQIEEMIMLGLRTSQGVNCANLLSHYGYDLFGAKQKEIHHLVAQHLIKIDQPYLKLTPRGYYLMNTILVELL